MTCEQARTQFSLYLYNELDEAARAAVEDHADACAACAAEIEKDRALLATLNSRAVLQPSPHLLAESRLTLLRAIDRERSASRFNPFAALREAWLSMHALGPAAVALMMATAFLGGWLVRDTRRAATSLPADAAVSNISWVQLDPAAPQQMQISFDELKRHTLTGAMTDPGIQKYLLQAASGDANPGVRLDTIDILRSQAGDRPIRNALLHLVSRDPNDGVRLKALESLQPYGQDPDVRRALIGVLTTDANPGMRVQAIDLLMQGQDRNLVGVLQGVAEREPNNYVRMRCRTALKEMNASTETF